MENANQLLNILVKEGDKLNLLKRMTFFIFVFSSMLLSSCKESVTFQTSEVIKEKSKQQIIVDIKGAITFPGIYAIEEDMLLIDVVKLAGGFTDQADISNLNLAMPVSDNQMIVIPLISASNSSKIDKNLININTSSLNELTVLPGIGEAKAQNIIDYRVNNGNFTSIEQLKEVKGISESIYNKIKTMVTL